MELKKFILSELRSIGKTPLNEDVTQLSGFTHAVNTNFSDYYEDMDKSQIMSIENSVIDMITDKFTGEFKEFLLKRLKKMVRKERVSILKIIALYFNNPSDTNNKNNVFELIAVPMLDFFLNKAFGKDSFWSRIRQVTPFMKKVSTGNSSLDMAIYNGLSEALMDVQVRKEFESKVGHEIYFRIDDLKDDSDFEDLFLNEVFGINKGLRSMGRGIKSGFQNSIERVKDVFVKREVRDKYKLVKEIIKYLPNLKSSLRGKIKDRVFQVPYEKIAGFFTQKSSIDSIDAVSYAITPVIIMHLIESAEGLYLKDFNEDFSDIIKKLFISDPVVKRVKNSVKEMIRNAAEILKDEERKKQKQQIKSKYQK